MRRRLVDALNAANVDSYRFERRRPEDTASVYPSANLDYRDNVSNRLAEDFIEATAWKKSSRHWKYERH